MRQKAICSRRPHRRRQEKWLRSCDRIKGKTVSPLGKATPRDVTRKTRRNGTAREEKETKASTILWCSRETVFCPWDGNILEYPFTKWKCHKFPWKAAILQHLETVFLDDWNGDDSGKTGHLRMELLFFSIQTVLLKGMATIPCNPVTYIFVIVKVRKEKGVVLLFHGRNSWDDDNVKDYKGKVCCSFNSVTLIIELNLNLSTQPTVDLYDNRVCYYLGSKTRSSQRKQVSSSYQVGVGGDN